MKVFVLTCGDERTEVFWALADAKRFIASMVHVGEFPEIWEDHPEAGFWRFGELLVQELAIKGSPLIALAKCAEGGE